MTTISFDSVTKKLSVKEFAEHNTKMEPDYSLGGVLSGWLCYVRDFTCLFDLQKHLL